MNVRGWAATFASWLLLAWPAATSGGVSVVERPADGPGNRSYPGNRAPLLPSRFIKLPVGAVRPEGWLRKQLELQAEGFHGHLTEISPFLRKEGNSWLSPDGQGDHGWEEVPYWLKGFGDCAYLLRDEKQTAEAKLWIEGALKSQRPDGFFGPRGRGAKATVESTRGKYDLWPNMVMLNCLQSYHEFTGDPRVLRLMRNYFRWELALPEAEFLPPYWQQQRAADNLASVYWLYNRSGEPWLLDLAAKIHRRTADWTGGIPSWHNVNAAQGFGGPATFYPQSKDRTHLDAAYRNYRTIRETYGRVPGGMWGGDENSRPGYTDPRQAIETCGMVEMMLSAERLLTVTGDPVWADRCEDVAFNSLPAALTADFKALRYLTAPNMAVSDRRSHAPGIENGGPMFCMDPNDHRCCQHNFGHGWPYLAEHLWLATSDNGLAAAFPLASRVTAKVGDGVEVSISSTTHYPFEGTVDYALATSKPVAFPLYLRIPGWCEGASVAVNGEDVSVTPRAGRYVRIDRTWSDGDRVRLTLPMAIRLQKWPENHGSVSVERGPLTFALKIKERTVRSGGTSAWPAWEIRPSSPWNYGLVLEKNKPASSFRVVERPWPGSNRPFTLEETPVEIVASARRIPEWQLDPFGLVAVLQDSPVHSEEAVESVTLIPMGAARLRISAFPVIGEGPEAHHWNPVPKALPYATSSSHTNPGDTLDALGDGVLPRASNDQTIPRFTWWDHKGTEEWVGYDFGKRQTVSRVEVYWFDDTPSGGCGLPASCEVQFRSGDAWKPVRVLKADPPARDRFNAVTFEPVEADALRLVVRLRPGTSGGILEWRVGR